MLNICSSSVCHSDYKEVALGIYSFAIATLVKDFMWIHAFLLPAINGQNLWSLLPYPDLYEVLCHRAQGIVLIVFA